MTLITIVIPVFFNEESLFTLMERLNNVSLEMTTVDFEYVFVDDGSGDNSFQVLTQIAKNDKRVKVIKLSRNFGSFEACFAGLTYSTGDCTLIMAADLQDPPELINDLYQKWKNGSEIVYAIRKNREESRIKVMFSNLYYRIFKLIALNNMPIQGFDFVLLGRKAVDVLVKSHEKNSTLMGQILWIGFKTDHLYYTKKERPFGKSKWTIRKKGKYFFDSIIAFSNFPIRAISFIGFTVAFLGFLFGLFIICQKIFFGIDIQGFATLVVLLIFTSGMQMIMLGVIGEYLWRNLEETKKRPIYIVEDVIGIQEDAIDDISARLDTG